MASATTDVVLKVLVLGDPATGKTSLIKRTITNSFSGLHKPTVGVDFHFRRFVEDDTSVALQLWDIAGQDRFGAIYRVYYKDAFGALLVFDLSRRETFENVIRWKREIDSKVSLPNGKPLPVLLLANKSDLDGVEINRTELDGFCKEHGFVGWFDTSAKTNHNVDKSVRALIRNILGHKDAFEAQKKAAESAADEARVALGAKEQKGSCC